MAQVKVLSAAHTGITVRSLERSIHLFHNILGLPLQRRNHLTPPISSVVGHPLAEMNTAFIELPGGHVIELLEYVQPADESNGNQKPQPWELGSWHLCLVVADLEATVDALKAAEWEGRSLGWKQMAPAATLTAGPNTGKKVCYLRDEDGLTLELFA